MAMASMVPVGQRGLDPSTSDCGRNGGFTLKTGSKDAQQASVRVKWCGVTSAVTASPPALAARTSSTEAGGRQVLEVETPTGESSQGDVAGDHQLLGLRRLAGHTQPARPRALVHVAAGGDRLVLAVLSQDHVEAGGVLQRPAHQPGVLHAASVVGEDPDAELGHLSQRRQLLAGPAHGDGPGRVDVAQRGTTELLHLAHDPGAVDGRLGVRHGHHRGEPAEGGRPRAGLDRLGLLPTRLAEMGVEIDQPRRHDASGGIDGVLAALLRQVGPDRGDAAGAGVDGDVGGALAAGIDHPPAPDDEDAHWASPRSRLAPSST